MRNVALVSISAAAAFCLLFSGCKKKAPPPPPPLKVEVITVTPRDVPIYSQWIGTLQGYPTAKIRAQVSGYLMKQDYIEGSAVKKDDLLFEIDPRPFQAALDQALAKLAQDDANAGKTLLDVKRFTPLAREQAVSQEELDDAIQSNLAAQAAIKADQALVEAATLNLSFCKITSPIDGLSGVAQAQIGDLVGPSSGTLTSVSTIDPMRVYFSISEQSYLATFRRFPTPEERTAHDDQLQLQLILSDGTTYAEPGKWFFTGNQVDVNTGTLQVAGLFPNNDYFLRPGQYGLVRATTETRQNALLVPQRAVTELQGSYQVAVVGETNKIHIATVQVGAQIGADWLIEHGLNANDRVVAEGTQKVKEGTVVDPQPYHAPAPDPAAK